MNLTTSGGPTVFPVLMASTRPVASCSIGVQTDYAQQSITGNVVTSEDPAQLADISCFVSLPWTWVEGIRPRGPGVAGTGTVLGTPWTSSSSRRQCFAL